LAIVKKLEELFIAFETCEYILALNSYFCRLDTERLMKRNARKSVYLYHGSIREKRVQMLKKERAENDIRGMRRMFNKA
jgi:hypothetical protein